MSKKFNIEERNAKASQRISELAKSIESYYAHEHAMWNDYKSGLITWDEYYAKEREVERWKREKKQLETLILPKKYASRFLWSDVDAYEVVGEKSETCILIRELDAELTEESSRKLHDSFVSGGFCGHFDNDLQEWEFKSNESNPIIEVRRHKDGNYYFAHDKSCPIVLYAKPYKHYDYNF